MGGRSFNITTGAFGGTLLYTLKLNANIQYFEASGRLHTVKTVQRGKTGADIIYSILE